MLALTVADRTPHRRGAGRGGRPVRLSGPPAELARAFLSDLLALAHDATERVLPLPPRVAEHWARLRARGRDPLHDAAQLEKLWGYDRDRGVEALVRPATMCPGARPSSPDPWAPPGEPHLLGCARGAGVGPIVRAQG
jgi:hypothetical protein